MNLYITFVIILPTFTSPALVVNQNTSCYFRFCSFVAEHPSISLFSLDKMIFPKHNEQKVLWCWVLCCLSAKVALLIFSNIMIYTMSYSSVTFICLIMCCARPRARACVCVCVCTRMCVSFILQAYVYI